MYNSVLPPLQEQRLPSGDNFRLLSVEKTLTLVYMTSFTLFTVQLLQLASSPHTYFLLCL